MNKRLILAIALSFLIMVAWARIMQKFYPIEQQEVTEKLPNQPSPVLSLPEESKETLINAISHNRELVFSMPSASLKKVIFSGFEDYSFDLEGRFSLIWQDKDLAFVKERLNSKEAVFVHQDEKVRITKRFNYSDPNFIITLDTEIKNLSDQALSYSSHLILGAVDIGSRGYESRFKEVFVKQPERMLRLSPAKETKVRYAGEFFGFRERYFCVIIMPLSDNEMFQVIRDNRTKSQLLLHSPTINLSQEQISHLKYKIYLGPQDTRLLNNFKDKAEEVIYYGFFDPIAKLLLGILRFFFRFVHNWGLAIILLSIVIYFVLFPLSMKQMRSTRDMQYLQPQIEELRNLYKNNPQRLNKEILGLYRKHKVNPLGGCLPMLLQIPIFLSFFLSLPRLVELKGADFLWIKDLSGPDRLIASPEINILPILMAITMFLQQRFTMAPATGSSTQQQRLMSFIIPIIFGIFFYQMPSCLVLYWFVNSLLMFVYQLKMKLIHEPVKY